MWEQVTLTYLRCSKLLSETLISLSGGCCCLLSTNMTGPPLHGRCPGTGCAFVGSLQGPEGSSSAYRLIWKIQLQLGLYSPAPSLWNLTYRLFFFFNPLFHSPFGRYLQEGFCPIHLLWHPCNGGKSKYLCKKNGGKGRCPLAKPCLSYHFLLVSLALNTLLVQ